MTKYVIYNYVRDCLATTDLFPTYEAGCEEAGNLDDVMILGFDFPQEGEDDEPEFDAGQGEAYVRNMARAHAAEAAVNAYAKVKENNNTDFYDFSAEDARERLCDLLADLRHLSRRLNLDFDDAARIAEGHFKAELAEEDEGKEAPIGWVIDVDHISSELGEHSRAGRRFGNPDASLAHRWRVKDADGEIYYEGRCSDAGSFAPLDFAKADAGATDIEYLDPNTGQWAGL